MFGSVCLARNRNLLRAPPRLYRIWEADVEVVKGVATLELYCDRLALTDQAHTVD